MATMNAQQLRDLIRPGLYEHSGRLAPGDGFSHLDARATDLGVEIVLLAPVKRTMLSVAEWNKAVAENKHGELFRSKIDEVTGN